MSDTDAHIRVHIASDHAGLQLKNRLLNSLEAQGIKVLDHGPFVYDLTDDYPVFCLRAAESVAADREEGLRAFGVVIGGSGNGELLAAKQGPWCSSGPGVERPGPRSWHGNTTMPTSSPSVEECTASRT
jgi:hypothetical protein